MEEGGPNGQPDVRERTEIQTIVDEVGKRPLGPTQRLVRLTVDGPLLITH
jgi:hypothetical protein